MPSTITLDSEEPKDPTRRVVWWRAVQLAMHFVDMADTVGDPRRPRSKPLVFEVGNFRGRPRRIFLVPTEARTEAARKRAADDVTAAIRLLEGRLRDVDRLQYTDFLRVLHSVAEGWESLDTALDMFHQEWPQHELKLADRELCEKIIERWGRYLDRNSVKTKRRKHRARPGAKEEQGLWEMFKLLFNQVFGHTVAPGTIKQLWNSEKRRWKSEESRAAPRK